MCFCNNYIHFNITNKQTKLQLRTKMKSILNGFLTSKNTKCVKWPIFTLKVGQF